MLELTYATRCCCSGIQYPIVCGGMTGLGNAELTAAISETGALGMLTALNQPTPELFRQEIAKTRALTKKPFGVNLTILPNMNPPPYEEYAQARMLLLTIFLTFLMF